MEEKRYEMQRRILRAWKYRTLKKTKKWIENLREQNFIAVRCTEQQLLQQMQHIKSARKRN